MKKIVLAGGCFWGMQELFRKQEGVQKTQVGYAGGKTNNPQYFDVKQGETGHAESLEITYDPGKTSLATILDFFFRIHDPTTENQQGNDKGTQYRSCIFYQNQEEKEEIEKAIERANQSKRWEAPVVTEVVAAGEFYRAEDYHQDYLQKNPYGYTCHFIRD